MPSETELARAMACRRARCARPSTPRRRQPRGPPPGQGNVRRHPHRRNKIGCFASYAYAATMASTSIPSGACSTFDAPGLRSKWRGCSNCGRATPLDNLASRARVPAKPRVLDEIVCRPICSRGFTRAKLESYRGSMYGFFETQFGVRMVRAQEKLRAVAADASDRGHPRVQSRRCVARRRPHYLYVCQSSRRMAAGSLLDIRAALSERAGMSR